MKVFLFDTNENGIKKSVLKNLIKFLCIVNTNNRQQNLGKGKLSHRVGKLNNVNNLQPSISRIVIFVRGKFFLFKKKKHEEENFSCEVKFYNAEHLFDFYL
jgi:hypothetical protein